MYAESIFLEAPAWSGHTRRRLLVSLMMSSICVAALLSVLRLPIAEQARPLTELFVRILVEEVESVIEPLLVDEPLANSEHVLVPVEQSSDATEGEPGEPVDWYAAIPDAVVFALTNAEKIYAINPAFDEKRRRAAEQFAPSKAVVPVPVWENVEKDTLGRSVLWSGDCYRVIDDPNAGSREAFETFGQYIVSCIHIKHAPRELPWVNEIRSRRASQLRYGPRVAE